jgi:hypothetical protein
MIMTVYGNDPDGVLQSLSQTIRRLVTLLDGALLLATGILIISWVVGRPIFYLPDAPVVSPFTAFSLLLLTSVRLCRMHLSTWPVPLSLAMIGLVLGGNASSILMLLTAPPGFMQAFPDIVITSIMTSVGLVLFGLHDLFTVLRKTPQSAFIFDDVVLHLALVPGGLSLLGYLTGNPLYLSIGEDPRVGISPLEMAFMGSYAVGAVLSNPRLFLWQFLAASWGNRIAFSALFANQFAAPVVVAFAFAKPERSGPGIELFVMLAGVLATLSFLLFQAWQRRSSSR